MWLISLIRHSCSVHSLHPLPALTPQALFPDPWKCYFCHQWCIFLCLTGFFLKHNQCFQSVLTQRSFLQALGCTIMRRDKPVSLWDASSNFLFGSPVMSWPCRESQSSTGWHSVDMQTSQKMSPENRKFLHTGEAVPRFQSNRDQVSLSPPSYKYMSGRALEGLSPEEAQFKSSPAVPVYAGHTCWSYGMARD